jgi:hypothetical protein
VSVFSQVVDVDGQVAFPTTPQVVIPFRPGSILVVLEDADDDAFLSFDGIADHWHLQPGQASEGVRFDQKVTQVWLREGTSGASPTNVRVTAEK